MFEPLLLANPDMNTLRHQCSRASTSAQQSAGPYAYFLASFLAVLVVARYARETWFIRYAKYVGTGNYAESVGPVELVGSVGFAIGCDRATEVARGWFYADSAG